MLKTPELTMPRARKVTTVCNGERESWADREKAKDFFLRQMMTAVGEERDRAECIYIQLMHGLDECSDELITEKRVVVKRQLAFAVYSE